MFDAEPVVNAVLARLASEMPAALDVVENRWTGDPITLSDVQEFMFGHHPTVLEKPYSAFPIIAVLVTDVNPGDTRSDQWGMQEQLYSLFIELFVHADTEEIVSKKTLRYTEAILSILNATQQLSTGTIQRSYVPIIEFSEVLRQLDDNSNNPYFTQMSRTSIKVEN